MTATAPARPTPTLRRSRRGRAALVMTSLAVAVGGLPVLVAGNASAGTGAVATTAPRAAAPVDRSRAACATPTTGPTTPEQLRAEQAGVGTVRRVACLARWRPERHLDAGQQARALAAAKARVSAEDGGERGASPAGTKSKSKTKKTTKTSPTPGPGGVLLPTEGLRPADLAEIYSLDTSMGRGATVAVIVAFDLPTVEDDLAVYRASFGLPACTTANGCFRKLDQRGGDDLPKANASWGVEITMDVQAVSATCPQCRILLVEADSDDLDDVGAATRTAAALGADVVSHSYGTDEFKGLEAFGAQYFGTSAAPDLAASGDIGNAVPLYPSVLRDVVAVGATSVVKKKGAWVHSAWAYSGSGCSRFVARPTWQPGKGCAMRATSDISAVGDPSTALAVYDTYGLGAEAGWLVIGGTSLATPIVAAMAAMSGRASDVTDASPFYRATSGLLDVRKGTNGTCSTVLCKARAGWDGPTGVGTPQGLSAF